MEYIQTINSLWSFPKTPFYKLTLYFLLGIVLKIKITSKNLNLFSRKFFTTKCKPGVSLLESIESKYMAVFKYIRLGDIMTTFTSAKRLESDAVIPKSWIADEYRSQTLKILRTENGHDYGEILSSCVS